MDASTGSCSCKVGSYDVTGLVCAGGEWVGGWRRSSAPGPGPVAFTVYHVLRAGELCVGLVVTCYALSWTTQTAAAAALGAKVKSRVVVCAVCEEAEAVRAPSAQAAESLTCHPSCSIPRPVQTSKPLVRASRSSFNPCHRFHEHKCTTAGSGFQLRIACSRRRAWEGSARLGPDRHWRPHRPRPGCSWLTGSPAWLRPQGCVLSTRSRNRRKLEPSKQQYGAFLLLPGSACIKSGIFQTSLAMSRVRHSLDILLHHRAPHETRMPSILSAVDQPSLSLRLGPDAFPGRSNKHSPQTADSLRADEVGGCPFAKRAQAQAGSPQSLYGLPRSASTSQCPVSGRFAPTGPPPAELDASAVPPPALAQAPDELARLWNEQTSSSVLYIPPLLSRLPHSTPAPSSSITSLPDTSVSWTDTHLPSIDPASLRLHAALRHLRPLTNAYAFVPYAAAFNWAALDLGLGPDSAREWYVVAFRSRRSPAADPVKLARADRLAHEEAVESGGLLGYWYGSAEGNAEGANLATCVWMSRAHALAANVGPRHMEAVALAKVSLALFGWRRGREPERPSGRDPC